MYSQATCCRVLTMVSCMLPQARQILVMHDLCDLIKNMSFGLSGDACAMIGQHHSCRSLRILRNDSAEQVW